MDYFRVKTNVSDWSAPPDITYSTPPYMSLREDIGPLLAPPPIRPRYFLDMRKKFNSRDITLRSPIETTLQDAKETSQEKTQLYAQEKYKKINSFTTKIHDKRSKWIIYNPTSGQLRAKPEEGDNTVMIATFEISDYVPMDPSRNKKPMTLKIKKENLYLSFDQSSGLKLENLENLDNIDESTKRFLFYRTDSSTNTTFESATSPQLYISTSQQSDLPVTVTSSDNQQNIIDFIMEQNGGLFNAGDRRISLKPQTRHKSSNRRQCFVSYTYNRFCV